MVKRVSSRRRRRKTTTRSISYYEKYYKQLSTAGGEYVSLVQKKLGFATTSTTPRGGSKQQQQKFYQDYYENWSPADPVSHLCSAGGPCFTMSPEQEEEIKTLPGYASFSSPTAMAARRLGRLRSSASVLSKDFRDDRTILSSASSRRCPSAIRDEESAKVFHDMVQTTIVVKTTSSATTSKSVGGGGFVLGGNKTNEHNNNDDDDAPAAAEKFKSLEMLSRIPKSIQVQERTRTLQESVSIVLSGEAALNEEEDYRYVVTEESRKPAARLPLLDQASTRDDNVDDDVAIHNNNSNNDNSNTAEHMIRLAHQRKQAVMAEINGWAQASDTAQHHPPPVVLPDERREIVAHNKDLLMAELNEWCNVIMGRTTPSDEEIVADGPSNGYGAYLRSLSEVQRVDQEKALAAQAQQLGSALVTQPEQASHQDDGVESNKKIFFRRTVHGVTQTILADEDRVREQAKKGEDIRKHTQELKLSLMQELKEWSAMVISYQQTAKQEQKEPAEPTSQAPETTPSLSQQQAPKGEQARMEPMDPANEGAQEAKQDISSPDFLFQREQEILAQTRANKRAVVEELKEWSALIVALQVA